MLKKVTLEIIGHYILKIFVVRLLLPFTAIQSVYSCPGFEKYGEIHKYTSEKPVLEFSSTIVRKSQVSQHIQYMNKDTILINKTGVEFGFNCWAGFPIDFNFTGHVSIGSNDVTVRIIRKPFESDKNKRHKHQRFCYAINVSLTAYEEATGEYSCFAVGNFSRQKSYYIFVSQSPPEVLLKKGQQIKIPLRENAETVTIPCAVSNPEIKVHLFKNDVEIFTGSRTLSFDPKFGFEMNITGSTTHWGFYYCKTFQSNNDIVYVELVKQDFAVVPKISNLRFVKNLNVTCFANDPITFTIEADNVPAIQEVAVPISSKTNSNETTFSYFGRFETGVITSNVTGRIGCKSANKTFFEWQFLISPNSTNRMNSKSHFTTPIKEACDSSSTSTLIMCQECNNWIECNMNKCVSKDKSCLNSRCTPKIPNAIIQCLNPHNMVSDIYFTGLNGSRQYNNWAKAEMNSIREILQVDRIGNKFYCEGSSFVFATGFRWSFSTNTTNDMDLEQDIPDEHKAQEVKQIWGSSRAVLKSLLDLKSLPVNTSKIICSAPVWNKTDEWRKVNMKIPVGDRLIIKRGRNQGFSNLIKGSSGFGFSLYCMGVVIYSMHLSFSSKL